MIPFLTKVKTNVESINGHTLPKSKKTREKVTALLGSRSQNQEKCGGNLGCF
ncbi:hypothetical protein HMPREF9996_00872 [Aggregatibacter actinomycetemcomitans Y4]|nr:hypothetical protein HMPREF9996_00872 [Aggregatibacter actinomycetemcomitans Y4]